MLDLNPTEKVLLEHYLATQNPYSATAFFELTAKKVSIVEVNGDNADSYGHYSSCSYIFSLGDDTYLVYADSDSLGNATEFNWYSCRKVQRVTRTEIITTWENV